jgi:hypothetical protein
MATAGPWLPLRRSDGLLTERVGDEVVVLDERSGQAHCLTAPAAAVWDLCDGSHGVARIGQLADLPDGEAAGALAALRELELLEPELDEPRRVTRRTVARRAIQAGAGAIVLSAMIPAAAAAASGTTPVCSPSTNCTSALLVLGTDPNCLLGICLKLSATVAFCVKPGCLVPGLPCRLAGLPLGSCCVGTCVGAIAGTCTGTTPCNPS